MNLVSPEDLARRMMQFQQDRLKAADSAVQRAAELATREAIELTSGPVNRPPTASPTPIGIRSGQLRGGWRVEPFTRGREHGFRLYNIAPHHRFVLNPRGTSRMKPRGFWTRLHRFSLAAFRRSFLTVIGRIPRR